MTVLQVDARTFLACMKVQSTVFLGKNNPRCFTCNVHENGKVFLSTTISSNHVMLLYVMEHASRACHLNVNSQTASSMIKQAHDDGSGMIELHRDDRGKLHWNGKKIDTNDPPIDHHVMNIFNSVHPKGRASFTMPVKELVHLIEDTEHKLVVTTDGTSKSVNGKKTRELVFHEHARFHGTVEQTMKDLVKCLKYISLYERQVTVTVGDNVPVAISTREPLLGVLFVAPDEKD